MIALPSKIIDLVRSVGCQPIADIQLWNNYSLM